MSSQILAPMRWSLSQCPQSLKAMIGGSTKNEIQTAEKRALFLSKCEKVTQTAAVICGSIAGVGGLFEGATYFSQGFRDFLGLDGAQILSNCKISCLDAEALKNCTNICDTATNYLSYVPVVILASLVFSGLCALASKALAYQRESIIHNLTDKNWGYVPKQLKAVM